MADIWTSFMKLRDITKDYEPFGKQVYNTHYQRILPIKKESNTNFITKALISKILFDKNYSFVTEWQMKFQNKVLKQPSIIDLDNDLIININNNAKYEEYESKNVTTNEEIKSLINDFEKLIIEQL